MLAGRKFCPGNAWTTLYEGLSTGSIYAWNYEPGQEPRTIKVKWRAYTVQPFWYSDGEKILAGRTLVTVIAPTPYVQFQVKPPYDSYLQAN